MNLPKSSWLISTKIIWPNKLDDQPGPSGGIRRFKCTVQWEIQYKVLRFTACQLKQNELPSYEMPKLRMTHAP